MSNVVVMVLVVVFAAGREGATGRASMKRVAGAQRSRDKLSLGDPDDDDDDDVFWCYYCRDLHVQ